MNPNKERRSINGFIASAFLSITVLAMQALSAKADHGGTVFADSSTQWSTTGEQGPAWFNFYYNRTADADGVYSGIEISPFLNNGTNTVGPDGMNHWDGTQYRLYRSTGPDTGPWTSVNREDSHPNGTNSLPPREVPGAIPEEHWVIRRWFNESVTGDVSLEWRLRKTNPNCGNGVTGLLFVDGVQVDSGTIASNDATGITRLIPISLLGGESIDLALSPRGTDGTDNDGCDGSAFRLRVLEPGSAPPPVAPPPVRPPNALGPNVADSADDWSTTGTQGERNWYNGYYNLTTDADGNYSTAELAQFVNSSPGGPGPHPVDLGGNHWNGSGWDLTTSPAQPWTELYREDTHPNGTNSPRAPQPADHGDEQFTVRRWVADVPGTTPVGINWQIREVNAGGTGIEGRLFINGVQIDQDAILGGNLAGITRTQYVNINDGDIVELHLGPTNPAGDRGDGADGSASRLSISRNLPVGPLVNVRKVADSLTDWSATGVQGANNWHYGYHDVRANGDYQPTDFTPFQNLSGPTGGAVSPEGNHWTGALPRKWDLMTDAGPWTELTFNGGHPAAPNGSATGALHWAVRRWVSEVDGEVYISGAFNAPATCGDGDVLRIFVDGVEVYDQHSQGDTINYGFYSTVSAGSFIDFAVDPDGAGVLAGQGIDAVNDFCDNFTLSSMVQHQGAFTPIPEPSTYALAGLGLLVIGWIARRRGKS
jgi:hypothetical protein